MTRSFLSLGLALCLCVLSLGCIVTSKGGGWQRVEWGTNGYVGVGRSNDGDKNNATSSDQLDVDPLVDNIIDLRATDPAEPSTPAGTVDPNGEVK